MNGDFPKRGDVYWVQLDPAKGSETRKTRPCVIISDDKGNQYSDMVIVAPITSKVKKVYPHEVKTLIADRIGKIMVNQLRAVDKVRLQKKECELDIYTLIDVDKALRIVFGLS